jgi:hypothetical protein
MIPKGRDGFVTVNLHDECDLRADVTELDSFCADDSVDEFLLSHTLEHIYPTKYKRFLQDLHRKLVPGGRVTVIQTDVEQVLRLWVEGKLNWRSMRSTIFTPATRLHNPYNVHYGMWSAAELCRELECVGFRTETFDAGSWPFDMLDDLLPEYTRACHGVRIGNLGVHGFKLGESST